MDGIEAAQTFARTATNVLKNGGEASPHVPSNIVNNTIGTVEKIIGYSRKLLGRLNDSTTLVNSISTGDAKEAGKVIAGVAASTIPSSQKVLEGIEEVVKKIPYGEKGLEKGRVLLSHGATIPVIGIAITGLPFVMGKRDDRSKGELLVSVCKTAGLIATPLGSEIAANICESAWEKHTGVKIESSVLAQIKGANSAMSLKADATQIDTFPVLPNSTPTATKLGGSKYDISTI
jgi:hypothetical protein